MVVWSKDEGNHSLPPGTGIKRVGGEKDSQGKEASEMGPRMRGRDTSGNEDQGGGASRGRWRVVSQNIGHEALIHSRHDMETN